VSEQTAALIILGLVLAVLWHIAQHLKAIRLATEAIREVAVSNARTLGTIETRVDGTKRLVERAIKKQWGSAIDV
jgi:hypothetical protein